MKRLCGVVSALAFGALGGCGERPLRSAPRESGSLVVPASAAMSAPPTAASVVEPPAPVQVRAPADEATSTLPIPARAQAPESPPSGWCGETAIQEGLLHLGMWAPQRLINKAGRPVHPDLYSPDIPVALGELGVRHTFYAGPRGFDAFARWVRTALDEGDPVLAGVKILPTEHPEWGLDHFVLVVGHGPQGLLVNTTWGTRVWVGDTRTPGLSFVNAFYGIRLVGLTMRANAMRARLSLVDERADTVTVRVTCSGVRSGAAYRMERLRTRVGEKALWSEEITAAGEEISRELTVEADRASRFQCVPL